MSGTTPPATRNPHWRLLIVEDEWLIVDRIRRALAGASFDTAAAAPSVAAAIVLLEANRFDAAVLDYNLAGERSDPVAHRLANMGIPYILLTGYGTPRGATAFDAVPVLTKPFSPHTLRGQLETLMIRARLDGR